MEEVIDKEGKYFVKFAAVVLVWALMTLWYKPAFTVAMIVFVLAVGFFYYKNKVVPKIEIPKVLLYSLGIFFVTLFVCALFTSNVKSNFAGAFEQIYLTFPFFMLLSIQSLIDVRKEIKYSLAAAAVGQFLNMSYDYFVLRIQRPGGFFGGPNDSAEMLGLVLPFFVYLVISEKDFKKRIFWVFVVVVDFLALCMTRCRGELFSVGIVALAFVLWILRSANKKVLFGAVFLSVVICGIAFCLCSGRQAGDMGRIYVYKSAFNMWKDYPLFGAGFGEWNVVYNSVYRLKSEVQGLIHAHNTYLMFLSGSGIVGTIAFLNLFVQMYQYFVNNIRGHRMYYMVGLVSITMFLLHAMVDSTYSIRYVTRFIWLMFAVNLVDFEREMKRV